jgi:hydrogenase maturation protein HypF
MTTAGTGSVTRRRARARVTGTVQGVGFRPFVYRLAGELELGGWVLNDVDGVLLEVDGPAEKVAVLLDRLEAEAPPLAIVEGVAVAELPARGEGEFRILASPEGGEPTAPVSPDTSTCAECMAEVDDRRDRRHRYPFTNCTNCGPRFTIVEGVPYDRPLTTMSGFEMCAECRREYEDPGDRRFHAQPNACPACGPQARLIGADGREVDLGGAPDAVAAAAAALAAGRLVAVKGLGGYHLACRADSEEAVSALRSRKYREEKPFAVMVANLGAARQLAKLRPAEAELLGSRERPIVLVQRRPGAALAVSVAPCSPDLGLMLPYSPLHHLLLAESGGPLVMTSGNVSDEPIAYGDAEALQRLGSITDLFLVHDRLIHIRTDDSVARVVFQAGAPTTQMLRRSRGFVPTSLRLPVAAARPVLACGAELKSTFCLAKGERAWVGHHIGDLENYETLRSFREGIDHFRRVFAVEPALCAHDLHPDYLSTRYALDLEGVELVPVQHHHAHLAACLAEHGEEGPALGAIFDGTGFGSDGAVWGGELLAGDLRDFERRGHLLEVRLPGGAAAIREPWRMACAWAGAALGPRPVLPATLRGRVEERQWRNCCELIERGIGSPPTSSIGRLFDAVGVLCGAPARARCEGQAAVELEGMCAAGTGGRYEMSILGRDGRLVLDPRPTVRAVLADLDRGRAPAVVAARFHETLAVGTAEACAVLAAEDDLDTVVLAGGVFQNRRLLERVAELLAAAGLRPLTPERLPPNDGGISFGQAAVTAARQVGA